MSRYRVTRSYLISFLAEHRVSVNNVEPVTLQAIARSVLEGHPC